jgi:hypothetical protein
MPKRFCESKELTTSMSAIFADLVGAWNYFLLDQMKSL